MEIIRHHYYSGPNIWADRSGLLLLCRRGNDTAKGTNASLAEAPESLERVKNFFLDAIPVARESEFLSSTEKWIQMPDLQVSWFLAISEIICRDFSWQPALGRVATSKDSNLQLFVPCPDQRVGLPAARVAQMAVTMAPYVGTSEQADSQSKLSAAYRQTRTLARQHGLNQSTLALARCAAQRGIPVSRLVVPGQHTQLGQGRYAKSIMETCTNQTSLVGRMMSHDKFATSTLLSRAGLPTPDTRIVNSVEEAISIVQQLNFPLVVKPRASGKGNGVTVGVKTTEELHEAVHAAAQFRQGAVIERYVVGKDYRLLVVNGCFVAAARRVPACVTGDGCSTVAQLVEQENRDPQRGMHFERLREQIELDADALKQLASAGHSLHSIPPVGQIVHLRNVANISRGGTSEDVTDMVHPDNRRLAERAARLIGLDITGIDFLTPDISRSWRDIPCAILEVNATPGLRPHLGSNSDRDVLSPIIDYLFPDQMDGRVPTVGITGSLGKTTTAQMVASILAASGKTTALSTTQGGWIGQDRVHSGDVAGGRMAQQLLQDPGVEAGVFELSRGGLLKRGMTLDAVDVGVLLNVYDNHLGIDGISTRKQLAAVKSLVIRHARKSVVLNADDPLCLAMRSLTAAPHICLVSNEANNPAVSQHLAAGGTAVTLHREVGAAYLQLQSGDHVKGILRPTEIPATLDGKFVPPILNAMFAVAVADALGIPFECSREALTNFRSDHSSNPGRMNWVKGLPFDLLITHADGPQALSELARFVSRHSPDTPKSLVVYAIGNRPDQFILDSGRVLAGVFDSYTCTDMEEDRRGREPGVIAALLAEGLRQGGVPELAITQEPSSRVAVEKALRETLPGALLVIESYHFEKVITAVRDMWPQMTI